MNTEALAKAVKEALKENGIEFNQKEARLVLDTVVEQIVEGTKEHGKVKVAGLGDFSTKAVAEKNGRNPRTGETVVVPAHNKLVVKPAKSFKETVR
jgi:DNA-binding protein HU-beta